MAYNSAYTGAQIDEAVGDVRDNKAIWDAKQSKIDAAGILKGDGDGSVNVAVPGEDYLAESDIVICHVTKPDGTYISDMSPSEISAAYAAGKIVVAVYSGFRMVFLLAGIVASSSANFIGWAAFDLVYRLQVIGDKTATMSHWTVQQKMLVNNFDSPSTTQYPTTNAVWNAIPHAETKTDEQTQEVGMDTDGKLWTKPGGGKITQYTATLLASGWSEDSHGYQAQTITIAGLAASYEVDPQWDVVLSGTDPDADAALLEGFALIHNYTTGENSLTAQCIGSAPTVNIPVKVVVFG